MGGGGYWNQAVYPCDLCIGERCIGLGLLQHSTYTKVGCLAGRDGRLLVRVPAHGRPVAGL